MPLQNEIQSPRGIRFECSGCANCCLQWPVPLTAKDYERISSLPLSSSASASTRPLRSSRENLQSFTHTLEKKIDGTCEFLQPDKRCQIHAEFGFQSKPSMCQLFPYSFTVTPDAVLCSLSFASSAVLYNSGRLLSEQDETMAQQFELFKNLFDCKSDAWQNLQLIDGHPLSWEKYREIDKRLLALIETGKEAQASLATSESLVTDEKTATKNQEINPPEQIPRRLQKAAQLVLDLLPSPTAAEREPRMESRPKIVDQIFLKHLDRLYFPAQVFAEAKYDLDARDLLREMVSAPQTVSFGQGKVALKFGDLINLKLKQLPEPCEDLLNRFLYVRFFSKLFFGPGFHHLSLLSGLNHLRVLHILLRLKIKQIILLTKSTTIEFEQLAELVRTLERRLTQMDFSGQSQAMLEVMLASPSRQERLPFLAD